jgi:peptide/nickel transport system substrate-binding protein
MIAPRSRRIGVSRRTLLKGAAGALTTSIGAPAQAQSRDKTLVFVHSNIASLDPVATGGYPVRNHAYMVYDQLYATDSNYDVKPQMVDGQDVSTDGKIWTIKLREGLKFHDGEAVRASDCVASIKRWGAKDTFGQTLMAFTDELSAVDDRNFRFRLKEPFKLLPAALGKQSLSVLFIMPERIASTPANVQIKDPVGSGPFKFVAQEWLPGSRAVYERNVAYVPRTEAPDRATGGKNVYLDRIEFRVIPDTASATAALGRGEVDWWERADINLLPLLERNANVVVRVLDKVGQLNYLRFNQLNPPFDNLEVRRAVLTAVNQTDYLDAMVGDRKRFSECKSFFFCGSPLSSGAGSEAMKGDLELAQKMLKASGYKGEKVVIISPQELAWLHPAALVTEDLLRRLGMNAEVQSSDLGTWFSRRASMEPVEKGGWSIFMTGAYSIEFGDPASHTNLRGIGKAGLPGWPTDPVIETLREQWLRAPNTAQQKEIAAKMEREAFSTVPYVPLGTFFVPTAYRKNITGILDGSAPFMWNVRKG